MQNLHNPDQPIIPIVMLTTGHWQFTRVAIAELARRTLISYRLIVIDGGSTDGTPEILTEMVRDGMVYVAILLSGGFDGVDVWRAGEALAEGEMWIQVEDVWLPPRDEPSWPTKLVEALSAREDYASIALRPSFFPRGMPSLRRDGDLSVVPWLEASFRCVRRDRLSSLGKSGYLDLQAEYIPSLALAAWH